MGAPSQPLRGARVEGGGGGPAPLVRPCTSGLHAQNYKILVKLIPKQ